MTKESQVIIGQRPKQNALNRLTSVLEPELAQPFGAPMPRIHTPLNDLPSRGQELIDFAEPLFEHGLMEWQKNLAIHSCKVKPDGRWASHIQLRGCKTKWQINLHDGAHIDGAFRVG